MKRTLYNDLLTWKQSAKRKPLVLKGARQVGKTWLLKSFGKNEYKHTAYINCDNNPQMKDVFFDFDTERIIRNIAAITNTPVVPAETLIVLDEIQEIPQGLASLKYFYENAPDYHVAVAGSFLGIAIHKDTSFPVGKVDSLELHPMSFEEFLLAAGEQAKLELLHSGDWQTIDAMRLSYIELLRQYYYVGGMPEVVSAYFQKKDTALVRKLQKNLVSHYISDISKHAPSKEIARIHMVWQSIPAQTAKENKKFVYGAIKKGGRAAEFELAIQWLVDCGIVYKINRINKASLPLKFYEDFSAFKLYLIDCGLMGAMSDTPTQDMLVGNSVFEEYKGAFTELYVLSQLKTLQNTPVWYYSTENSTVEVDFILQKESTILPIEVKAEENLRSKSLKTFIDHHSNLRGIRFSMSPYREQDWMINVPLYGVLPWLRKR